MVSLLWTVLVHTYLQLFAVGENRVKITTKRHIMNITFNDGAISIFQFSRKVAERTFGYQMIGNASFSVDTFFFISGLLVVLLYLRSAQNANSKRDKEEITKKKENPFLIHTWKIVLAVFYRFIRLTPVYLFVIIFTELSLK
jgi:peptidoglycan/LPS O-acetylase OafA/YrhL